MLNQELERIKELILQYNTYFSKGFANAFKDSKGVRQGETVVFPNDTLGDYFYFRYPNNYRITQTRDGSINDCTTITNVISQVICVACVRRANSDALIGNIISVLASSGAKVTEAIGQKHVVIVQELQGMAKEDIEKASQNVSADYTIVCVKFDVQQTFYPVPLNCLQDPCVCQ